MESYKKIDKLMAEGQERIMANDSLGGCDKWLEAWNEIKMLLSVGVAKDIFELDKKYSFIEFISNYVQDLETELHNAGVDDKRYHQKRVDYCGELLQWCGSDKLLVENTRRGMATAYFELGENAIAERLYTEWLEEDPDWGYGYIGWSDYYQFNAERYERAEELLLTGYAREGLRDRTDLLDRLVALYEDMGKTGKAKEYKDILLQLQRSEMQKRKAAPTRAVKVGRNEPCPCGSGKKHKKCCLR